MNKKWIILTKHTLPEDFENEAKYYCEIKDGVTWWKGEWCNGLRAAAIILGSNSAYRYRILKGEKMNKKEKALKELDEIKKRTAELERILNEPETYPCVTPVEARGQILFNHNKQLLNVNEKGLYTVEGVRMLDHYVDYSKDFVWVACKREDLKVGDTAYRSDVADTQFSYTQQVCKILCAKTYVCMPHDESVIAINDLCYASWYKLVRKDEEV